MSIESLMPSNWLTFCHLHPLLPSIFPNVRIFSNEHQALRIRWPKYWSYRMTGEVPRSSLSGHLQKKFANLFFKLMYFSELFIAVFDSS